MTWSSLTQRVFSEFFFDCWNQTKTIHLSLSIFLFSMLSRVVSSRLVDHVLFSRFFYFYVICDWSNFLRQETDLEKSMAHPLATYFCKSSMLMTQVHARCSLLVAISQTLYRNLLHRGKTCLVPTAGHGIIFVGQSTFQDVTSFIVTSDDCLFRGW